ncbi:MAG: tripartite tricarboxylate transporter permease [Syntrophales bacterium]|jgi:putative tricarboxylic transport membrane protein|nr:tripartite tricarboxylate transporter permease [Syntrophales bacterium]
MDLILNNIHGVFQGFAVALQPEHLFFIFTGCFLGTLVGVLPGIGPVGAISIVLPITFQMSPTAAVIMLAGIYYGVMYGGSTTSILLNVPGEAASVVTCLDGYQMARQGRAGPALSMAAVGSFLAGTLGLVGLQLIAAPLADVALKFGPPEYFAIILVGFIFIVRLTGGPVIKSAMMACLGLILSQVGLDPVTSEQRMTFGLLHLFEGIGIAPLAMGLFGVAEVFANLEAHQHMETLRVRIRTLIPSRRDWLRARWAMLRGTMVGFFMGILPGGGPVLSTFIAYGLEKRIAKNPNRFGKGAIEGVAAPEAANNAAASTSFIPLMTLGIPPNVVLAILFGAFLIHGVTPGPLLLRQNPDMFWGIIGSMYIGNVILLVLNLPLIPLWVQVLKIPKKVLYPLILLFCVIGAYSVNNSVFDIYVMIFFGLFGCLLRKYGYEGAPLVLAFVLGPLFEVNLRRSLLMSGGSFTIFFTRPIALAILIAAFALLMIPACQAYRKHFPRRGRPS